MREVTIGSTRIADDTDTYVIAEIGQNHQGELDTCKALFKIAAECGVNAVKLQKRDNRHLFTKAMYNSAYDNENSFGTTYGEHREALEFNMEEFKELKRYSDDLGITMFSTAWDFPSVDFLEEVGVDAYKVASGDLVNIPLIKYIAQTGKPIIVSTGGGTMEDVQRMVEAVLPINKQLCVLQCTAAYPAQPEEMNLKVIELFRESFPDVVVGLSDHQNGIAMSMLGYCLGARVFEKHFTLNRAMKGGDHKFSLEPVGMRKFVRDLRRARLAMGSGSKSVLDKESKPIQKMRKSIVAARDLPAGHVLTKDDLALKSPGGGMLPYELEGVIGQTLASALPEDELLSSDLLS